MDELEVREIIKRTVGYPDLSFVRNVLIRDSATSFLKGLLGTIPCVGSVLSESVTVAMSISDYVFFKKFASFVYGIQSVSYEDRQKFLGEIEKYACDDSGSVLFNIINRLDNLNKVFIITRLVCHRVENNITICDFFRLSHMVDRIPYSDLGHLSHYLEPFFNPNGETEVMIAAGAVTLVSISSDSNSLYQLSVLGSKLLEYGLGVKHSFLKKKGISIPIPDGVAKLGDVIETVDMAGLK